MYQTSKISGGRKNQEAKNKITAFNEGNQDNSSKLNEGQNKNEDPAGKKITNQDQDVTNVDDQHDATEDASANLNHETMKSKQEKGLGRDDGSPEINIPAYEPDETEKILPKMNENL